jgi:cytochrome c-type biogenesis protein CcmH
MVFWTAFALMTGMAIFAVLWPLARRKALRDGSDVAVYRDQLDEITRDRSASLIGEAEAQAARIEVSRRLIGAADVADREKPATETSSLWRRRAMAIAALILLPAGAVGLYLMLGSPDLPGEPLAARLNAPNENRSIQNLVAQVEAHVERNPTDARGWEVLAPVYMQLGRFDEAVRAWRHVVNLSGSTAPREASLGEAQVAAADGIVTDEAKASFERALKLDPQDVMARFYVAMAVDQDGRRAEAEAIWRDLLAKAPPNAPWIDVVRHALARNAPAGAAPNVPAAAAAPGPSATDIAAAKNLKPEQRDEMIEGMVARLADRLKNDGSDVDGWLRLVRSYRVLHQDDKALASIADAERALASDPDKLARFAEAVGGASPTAPAAAAPGPGPGPGPSAADVDAAAKLNPDQQKQMITGMVARLADRLKNDGSDVDGWLRLVRSYSVLGEPDKARAALADARRALAGDPDKLRRIDKLAKSLGIGS